MASFRCSLAAIGLFSSIAFSSAGHAVSVLPQQGTTGEDGIFSLSGDLSLTVPTDGIFNYTDFIIDAGASLSIQSDNPVFIYGNDFHLGGAIFATVPELYLIGSTFTLDGSATLSNPDGLLSLYISGSASLAGSIDVNSGSDSAVTLTAGSDIPEVPAGDSVIVLSGNISLLDMPAISVIQNDTNLTTGDIIVVNSSEITRLQSGINTAVLDPDSVLTLNPVPVPGAAILFVSGLLGLFARRWG